MMEEFDRQLENLLHKNYPEAAGLSVEKFKSHILPLKEKLKQFTLNQPDLDKGYLPFVIVIKNESVSAEKAMSLVDFNGKTGFVNLFPIKTDEFKPIKEVSIPEGIAYVIIDVDRGRESLNVRPEDAFKMIAKDKRSPLTIDEGLAIITHYPDFLKKNNCFSLLASRCGDKRVPAIWISEQKPRLGWCWDGNPHTWLGSASCAKRIV